MNNWFRNKNKPLSTILREQKVNEKLAMMGTKENPIKKAIDLSKEINDMPTTPTKRSKKHEHKPNNNIRLQITIDCRIL